jgi:hypothetical protein
MAPGRKTGGRIRGVSINKPKPIIMEPTSENRELVATAQLMRTPKAVMLDAMMRFENLGLGFLTKADRLMKRNAGTAKVAEAAHEGHKFIVAAVECATKVAPYIHARLLSMESRGDMTQDKAPYVVRVPAVLADSTAWQTAVGAALGEAVASKAPSRAPPAALPDPVPLVTDQKTGRISTMRPARPVVVKPTGTQEWLESVASQRKG